MSDTQDTNKVNGTVYTLPRDEGERRRLALQSQILLRAFDNKVLHAPVELKDGDWVLDAGTGSGAWLQEFVDQIPTKVQFIGIDISPTLFPDASIRPPNSTFEIQSVIALPTEWTDKFTLVHQRLLIAGLRRHEWEVAVKQMYRVVKPGGWVQLLEKGAWTSGPSFTKFDVMLNKLSDDLGLMLSDITFRLPDFLRQSGFVNISQVTRRNPLGATAGQVGIDWKVNVMGVIRGHKKSILARGGYGVVKNEIEWEELMEDISKELDNTPGSTIDFTMFV